MNFRKIEITDKRLLDERLAGKGLLGSDYCFGSWFSWYNFDNMKICVHPEAVYIMAENGDDTVFLPPIADDFPAAVNRLKAFADKNNIFFKIVFATEEQASALSGFTVTGNRDNAEYIYAASDLIGLSGKKYHAKRNYVSRFQSKYNYDFLPYEDIFYGEVSVLLDSWAEEKGGVDAEEEKAALSLMLKYRTELDLFADVIKVDGKIAGISIGEITSNGTGVVLFEKADFIYEGIYQALNQMFARAHFKGVTYINRQEDMGLPGLRKAKQSYHPFMLLEKFTITPAREEQLKNIYSSSFDDSKKYIEYFFKEKIKDAQIFTVEKDGVIQSALYCFNKGLTVEGKYIDARFITAAATLPWLRGQKIMADLIRQTLKKLYADGVALIMLEPFKQDYYTRYGFVTVTEVLKGAAQFTGDMLKEKITVKASEFKKAYDGFCASYDFYINRGEEDFARRIKELAADKGKGAVVYDGRRPIGYYLLADGQAEECVLPASAIGRVEGLDGKEVILPAGQAVPIGFSITGSAQARIVNLYRFVESLSLPEGLDIRLKITDEMFCANSGVFRLTCCGGSRIEVADGYDVELTIAEFTKLALVGGRELSGLSKKRTGFIVDRY